MSVAQKKAWTPARRKAQAERMRLRNLNLNKQPAQPKPSEVITLEDLLDRQRELGEDLQETERQIQQKLDELGLRRKDDSDLLFEKDTVDDGRLPQETQVIRHVR